MVSLPGRTYDEWEQVCGAGRRALARKGFCRELEGMTAWKGQWGTVQYWWVSLPLGMSGMGEWVTGAAREVRCVLRGELAWFLPSQGRAEVRGGLVKHWSHGECGAWCCTHGVYVALLTCRAMTHALSVWDGPTIFCLLSNVSNWNSVPSLNALSSLWCVPVVGGS